MADKSPEVYGTVTGIDDGGTLLVTLDSGERGAAEFDQISRQTNIRRDNLERMIGWHMGFISEEMREDGRIGLSGRAFEEREYQKICEDFRSGVRNVYQGRLASVTADGKLAFYRLAQGVTGALHVSMFSLGRVYSFRDIDLPRELTVVVSGIDSRGWLSLSSKPSFGDFEESLQQLQLTDGALTEGVVANIMADGAAAIMLAPNLTVLTDACCRVYPGDRVRLRIRRIDHEQHRVKAQMLEKLETEERRFNYCAWNRAPGELGKYVDLQAFDERIRLNKPQNAPKEEASIQPEEMDFSVSATRSPFSSYLNERVIREEHKASRVQDIYFESRMGYLGEKHMKVAQAIEELKYSSAWQVRRYLFLKEKLSVSEREMKGIIDRLVKHDIVGVLRFQSDEGSLLTRVLHPSLNFRVFCGRNPRNFGPKDYMESDASGIKMRLASNQLLIGFIHGREGIEAMDTHPFLRDEETDIRLRPRHMLEHGGKKYYLEAIRIGSELDFLDKLGRYDRLLPRRQERAEVIAVLEEKALIGPMSERVKALKLSFPVFLTDDLGCLPEPELTEIPAPDKNGEAAGAARQLLNRIRQKIEDRG